MNFFMRIVWSNRWINIWEMRLYLRTVNLSCDIFNFPRSEWKLIDLILQVIDFFNFFVANYWLYTCINVMDQKLFHSLVSNLNRVIWKLCCRLISLSWGKLSTIDSIKGRGSNWRATITTSWTLSLFRVILDLPFVRLWFSCTWLLAHHRT